MATTLPAGALAPQQTQQTGTKSAVSLIDSLLNSPTLPQNTVITPTSQNVQDNELLNTPGVTGTAAAQAATASSGMASGTTGATPTAVSTITPATAAQVTPATVATPATCCEVAAVPIAAVGAVACAAIADSVPVTPGVANNSVC